MNQLHARQRIHQLVWNGFHPDASIAGLVADTGQTAAALTESDRAWIQAEVADACADKRAAESGWPAQTEYDRIEVAFAQLRKDRFIALHPGADGGTTGQQNVQSAWRAAGSFNSGIRGCCFYHEEDVDQAITSGQLTLAFSGGMIPESNRREANTRLVARRILEALRAVQFLPAWSGDLSARIELPLGQWRKRAPRG